MTNPIQLLRDFMAWRKYKYRQALIERCQIEACLNTNLFASAKYEEAFRNGILYGIEHRKEILKNVKI